MGWAGDVAKERAALMRAQRRKIHLQTAALRGELVPRAQVREIWGRLVGNFKARCLGIPSKLAGMLTGLDETAVIRERIEREILEALAELSGEGNLERLVSELEKLPAPTRRNPRSRNATAKADSKRVGRRKPPAKS